MSRGRTDGAGNPSRDRGDRRGNYFVECASRSRPWTRGGKRPAAVICVGSAAPERTGPHIAAGGTAETTIVYDDNGLATIVQPVAGLRPRRIARGGEASFVGRGGREAKGFDIRTRALHRHMGEGPCGRTNHRW